MAYFDVKPLSMSVAQVDRDSQPIQLNKYSVFVDDTTQTWGVFAGNPAFRGAQISRVNPLLISFKLPQQVVGIPSGIQSLSLGIRYRYNGSLTTRLQVMLLPFVAKRINDTLANNRSVGFKISRFNSLVSNGISAGWEIGYQPVYTGYDALAYFDGESHSDPNNRFIGMSYDGNLSMPLSLEYLRSLVGSNSTPILTFAVFPDVDDPAQPITILEPVNAATPLDSYLRIITAVDFSNNNEIYQGRATPTTYAPVATAVEESVGRFFYSMGVSVPHQEGYTPGMLSFGNVDRTHNLGKFTEAGANLAPQFVVAMDAKHNLLTNGAFKADRGISSYTLPGLYADTGTAGPYSTALPVPGWNPRNATTQVSTVSLDGSTIYTAPIADTYERVEEYASSYQAAMLVETYDSTNTTNAWVRSVNGSTPASSYWQYGTVGQQVGVQMEDDEDYLLEAWVRPYYAAQIVSGNPANFSLANARVKIRMSYLSGYLAEADPDDANYFTYSTGGNSDCSVDATFPSAANASAMSSASTWQRVWVKVRLPKRNTIQRLNARYDVTAINPNLNDVLFSDPSYITSGSSVIAPITTFGEVRFDVIPVGNTTASTYRFDTKFLVANVSLTKLNDREYNASSSAYGAKEPRYFERTRGAADGWENLLGEDATFYVPMRGTTNSAYNTSMLMVHSQAWVTGGTTTQDETWSSTTRYANVKRITTTDSIEYGGLAAKPRTDNHYEFSVAKTGGKYPRGSHLILRAGDTVSIPNPNAGTLEFLYSPTHFLKVDPLLTDTVINSNLKLESAAKFFSVATTFKPYTTNSYADYIDSNGSYVPYQHTISIGSPKHILSLLYTPSGFANDPLLGGKAYNGQLYSGAGVSFFRQGRMIYCLIYEPGDMQHPYNNQNPLVYQNSIRRQQKFSLLKYMIPESLFKMKNHFSTDSIPSWFHIKLVWGARQELYVNGELVDFNNLSGLFQAPSRMVTENTKVFNNVPNTIWMGAIGMLSESPNSWENAPLVHTDNMILRDILVSSTPKHQSKLASSKSGYSTTWKGLENLNQVSTATATSVTNA